MRTRTRILSLAAPIVLVGAIVAIISYRSEPHYHGRKLSDWLSISRSTFATTARREEAATAIRAIGTNGLPFLIRDASGAPPRIKGGLQTLISQHPIVGRLTPPFLRHWIQKPPDLTTLNEARMGLMILGTNAAPAIPELTRMALGGESSHWAISALGDIGETAMPALIEILTNQAAPTRYEAAMQFAKLGTNALPALPIIIGYLEDRDPYIRHACAGTIGDLALEPEQSIPALLRCMRGNDRNLKAIAMISLSKFGTAAQPAIPELRELARRETDTLTQTVIESHIARIERATPDAP